MITINTGLSDYVAYYWFDDDGNAKYITADGVRREKKKLDKIFKHLRIKKLLKIVLPVFLIASSFISLAIICFAFKDHPDYDYITAIVKLPFMVVVCISFISFSFPISDEKPITYRLRRFKELFGKYFDLDKYWTRLIPCDAGEGNCKLSIAELMGRMELGI